MEVGSPVEVGSLADIGCCSASLRVLMLGCILVLGLELQLDSIALRAFLGPSVFDQGTASLV